MLRHFEPVSCSILNHFVSEPSFNTLNRRSIGFALSVSFESSAILSISWSVVSLTRQGSWSLDQSRNWMRRTRNFVGTKKKELEHTAVRNCHANGRGQRFEEESEDDGGERVGAPAWSGRFEKGAATTATGETRNEFNEKKITISPER